MIIDRGFYRRDAVTVAKELLGKVLVYGDMKGRIVETEAYTGPEDKASHAFGMKRTERTETMYMDGGTAYVYLTYGMYNMLNVVSGEEDYPAAVLIRGIEPVSSIDDFAMKRFGTGYSELSGYRKKNLTCGPGKLTMAMGIDRSLDGVPLFLESFHIYDDRYDGFEIGESARIGIDYADDWKDKKLRFYILGNSNVSKAK